MFMKNASTVAFNYPEDAWGRARKKRHLHWSLATTCASFQLFQSSSYLSFSNVRLQVFLGLPRLLIFFESPCQCCSDILVVVLSENMVCQSPMPPQDCSWQWDSGQCIFKILQNISGGMYQASPHLFLWFSRVAINWFITVFCHS